MQKFYVITQFKWLTWQALVRREAGGIITPRHLTPDRTQPTPLPSEWLSSNSPSPFICSTLVFASMGGSWVFPSSTPFVIPPSHAPPSTPTVGYLGPMETLRFGGSGTFNGSGINVGGGDWSSLEGQRVLGWDFQEFWF
ncbi:hypothetical protein BDN72DRAFT_571355 [Pluteus cervinus]|uniref:Uncharacterized protein n=1 Tax=Pluteus cervinus TaxID=181527 RepID=A0ACD3A2H2_9AGAR|nr:hypothetical protein BDN72DRAFT_571355 [Pluteus cervinus]